MSLGVFMTIMTSGDGSTKLADEQFCTVTVTGDTALKAFGWHWMGMEMSSKIWGFPFQWYYLVVFPFKIWALKKYIAYIMENTTKI